MNAAESRIWYAMRVTYRRELAAEAILNAKGIACYIPKKQCPDPKNKGKKIAVPVIHNLIFVHATPSVMRKLKSDMEIPYLQYMMDARAGKKITVPDRQMRLFIAATADYDDVRSDFPFDFRPLHFFIAPVRISIWISLSLYRARLGSDSKIYASGR